MKSIQDEITSNNYLKHNRVASYSSSSPCCRTVAMTIASSPSPSDCSSEEVKVGNKVLVLDNNDKPLSEVIANCLICFWPMHNIDVGDDQPRPRNDCFVAVNDYDWHSHAVDDTALADNSTFYQTEQNITTIDNNNYDAIGTLPLHHQHQMQAATGNNCKLLLNKPPAPRRLTPVTVQTQSRTSLTEHNGATLTSNNTLHRRTDDISVGFFTNRTLDEIHDEGGNDGDGDRYQIGTPRCQQQQQNTGNNISNNNNHRVVYQTPGNRVRIDSDSFRRTIKVVTCEKRRISDESDISPIESDAGFNLSPMILDTKHKRVAAVESVESLLSPPAVDSSQTQKRLLFDVDAGGGGQVRLNDASPDDVGGGDGKGLLFYDNSSIVLPESSSFPLSPISEFGMNVMKSLQSIIQGGGSRLTSSPATLSSYAKKDSVSRHTPASTTSNNDKQALWQDYFLPKSSPFLKALRRSGRRGKVLIQGWVAFRENTNLPSPSWKEIIRNPQRFDFRYIILLDDMPTTLHIFSSRRKQKKKKMAVVVSAMQTTKHDVLRDCIHLNLTSTSNKDLAVRINLVSKALGNEVCIFEKETGVECYSFLPIPIPIPSNVFVDKHRSRLAKGEILEGIFVKYVSMSSSALESSPSNDVANVIDRSKSAMTTKTIDYLRASVEQYDVSRHLLFVLDAAIFAANQDSDRIAVQ